MQASPHIRLKDFLLPYSQVSSLPFLAPKLT